jgi:isoleucyl-tRNA synthetase
MAGAKKAVGLGRALRNTHNLKNRQPLKAVYLVTRDAAEKAVLREMEDLIREELNVKEVLFQDNEEALVEYGAKANFKVLGKVLGAQMKAAAARIEGLSAAEIATIVDGSSLHLEIAGIPVELNAESVMVTRKERANLKVLNEGSLTVALDGEVTRELKLEGHLRDMIRAVQNARKDSGFAVSDRIRLVFSGSPVVRETLDAHTDLMRSETLAIDVTWDGGLKAGAPGVLEGDSGDEAFVFTVTKA